MRLLLEAFCINKLTPCLIILSATLIVQGVIASGVTLTVMAWCIRLKGPLFASVFNPLMLVMVAILCSLLLDEKLHLGRYIYILASYSFAWETPFPSVLAYANLVFSVLSFVDGSLLGAVLIVGGLYLVLWGKGREAAKVAELPVTKRCQEAGQGGVADLDSDSHSNRPLEGELLMGKSTELATRLAAGTGGRASAGTGFDDGLAKSLHDKDGGRESTRQTGKIDP